MWLMLQIKFKEFLSMCQHRCLARLASCNGIDDFGPKKEVQSGTVVN